MPNRSVKIWIRFKILLNTILITNFQYFFANYYVEIWFIIKCLFNDVNCPNSQKKSFTLTGKKTRVWKSISIYFISSSVLKELRYCQNCFNDIIWEKVYFLMFEMIFYHFDPLTYYCGSGSREWMINDQYSWILKRQVKGENILSYMLNLIHFTQN